jgi:hypothetical protein
MGHEINETVTNCHQLKLEANYAWSKLKERLNKEASELVTNCHQFKMVVESGKSRLTDATAAETLFG